MGFTVRTGANLEDNVESSFLLRDHDLLNQLQLNIV